MRIAPSGVRSSCEIMAMNSSFARFDDSASARADGLQAQHLVAGPGAPGLRLDARGQLARGNAASAGTRPRPLPAPEHAVGLRARRHHDDGDAARAPVGAQGPDQVLAHGHVGEDDVRRGLERGGEGGGGLRHRDHVRAGEGRLRRRAQRGVGDDDEDARGPRRANGRPGLTARGEGARRARYRTRASEWTCLALCITANERWAGRGAAMRTTAK